MTNIASASAHRHQHLSVSPRRHRHKSTIRMDGDFCLNIHVPISFDPSNRLHRHSHHRLDQYYHQPPSVSVDALVDANSPMISSAPSSIKLESPSIQRSKKVMVERDDSNWTEEERVAVEQLRELQRRRSSSSSASSSTGEGSNPSRSCTMRTCPDHFEQPICTASSNKTEQGMLQPQGIPEDSSSVQHHQDQADKVSVPGSVSDQFPEPLSKKRELEAGIDQAQRILEDSCSIHHHATEILEKQHHLQAEDEGDKVSVSVPVQQPSSLHTHPAFAYQPQCQHSINPTAPMQENSPVAAAAAEFFEIEERQKPRTRLLSEIYQNLDMVAKVSGCKKNHVKEAVHRCKKRRRALHEIMDNSQGMY